MPVLTNPKHERFSQEVAQGRSASEAFVIAGYKAHDGNAARLRGNEKVRTRIEEILAEGAQRAGVTVERIVRELAKIGFANMGSYLHATSGGDPFFDYASLGEDEKAALSEVTVEDFKEGRGENARDVRRVKFKLHDKLVALEKLGKHLGMFVDRKDLSGNLNISHEQALEMLK